LRRALTLAVAVLASAPAAQAAERITVDNGGTQLGAVLSRPLGNGPYPAVVLMHGCGGLWSTKNGSVPQRHIKRWLSTLARQGYVAIAVDSFTARGVKRVCGLPPSKTGVSEVTDRVTDAFAALERLRSLPYVDPARVAVLGWSNGGSAALASVGEGAPAGPPADGGFRAAVAFYPGCGLRDAFKTYRPTVPTRVLSAQDDPLTKGCSDRREEAGSGSG
jgi:dienelactone hydrolase